MSGRAAASPGGQLLRSSRLFSMPKPIPEPYADSFNQGIRSSPTMTRPFPTHQAVTTPKSSRDNGDWGFKRSFPLKSTTNTSTPLIRVKQVDTIEHVTDFASASDLTMTLEKFQEMRVAPVLPESTEKTRSSVQRRKGVFEEDMDVTTHKPGEGADTKWKFHGPWLARMDEGEFEAYLQNKVRPKRSEFRRILKQRMLEDKNRAQANIALEKGLPAPEPLGLNSIQAEEFTEYLRMLRNNRPTLYSLVADFLDLAPLTTPVGIVDSLRLVLEDHQPKKSPYGTSGAPSTHPSAGIGYLRTNAFMDNHPVFGPQSTRKPVQARIIYPRTGISPAKLGVGGMVVDAPRGNNTYNMRYGSRKSAPGIDRLDVVTYGGAKGWVEPTAVVVDPSGSVVLQVQDAEAEARLVAEETTHPEIIYHAKRDGNSASTKEEPQRFGQVADEMLEESEGAVDSSTVRSTPQWYGLGS